MKSETARTTIYLTRDASRALRVKAAVTHRSVSDLVNEAVLRCLKEDHEDLEAFEARAAEPALTYEALLKDLRSHGKL